MNKPTPKSQADQAEDSRPPIEVAEDIGKVRPGYLACPLCEKLVHQCVILTPCKHQFCGGCLSGWTQDKWTCPYCYERYFTISRNLLVDELLGWYLMEHPEERRSREDIEDLERRNMYHVEVMAVNVAAGAQETPVSKAPALANLAERPLLSLPPDPRTAQYWQGAPRCVQCHRAVEGYRCLRDQQHVDCYLCKQPMPCREGVPQQCHVCQLYFCNIYYRKIKHCDLGIHTIEWYIKSTFSQVPEDSLCCNTYEQQVLKDALRNIGMPLPMLALRVIDEMNTTGLSFNIEGSSNVRVSRSTYLCGACASGLWKEILMFQRVRINPNLPDDIRNRQRCRHGIHCRNQKTMYNHALKYNHIV